MYSISISLFSLRYIKTIIISALRALLILGGSFVCLYSYGVPYVTPDQSSADCTDYSLLDLNYVRRTTVRRTEYFYSVVITTVRDMHRF